MRFWKHYCLKPAIDATWINQPHVIWNGGSDEHDIEDHIRTKPRLDPPPDRSEPIGPEDSNLSGRRGRGDGWIDALLEALLFEACN
jgi:hypothetical protein